MKKILVKYTAEIDEDYRYCKKNMIGDRDFHIILQGLAKNEGLKAIRIKMQEE